MKTYFNTHKTIRTIAIIAAGLIIFFIGIVSGVAMGDSATKEYIVDWSENKESPLDDELNNAVKAKINTAFEDVQDNFDKLEENGYEYDTSDPNYFD